MSEFFLPGWAVIACFALFGAAVLKLSGVFEVLVVFGALVAINFSATTEPGQMAISDRRDFAFLIAMGLLLTGLAYFLSPKMPPHPLLKGRSSRSRQELE